MNDTNPFNKALFLSVALTLAGAASASANLSFVDSANGVTYNVTTVTGSFFQDSTELQENIFWNNGALALSAAAQVGVSALNFAYSDTLFLLVNTAEVTPVFPIAYDNTASAYRGLEYAIATPATPQYSPVPETATVVAGALLGLPLGLYGLRHQFRQRRLA